MIGDLHLGQHYILGQILSLGGQENNKLLLGLAQMLNTEALLRLLQMFYGYKLS
jgi:hypothetical protein